MSRRRKKIKRLKENAKNGFDWFISYQNVDSFIFKELNELGLEFPVVSEDKPELNTIEAIKLLIKQKII